MPSEATSAEPWASWPKPGRKTLGAISAKTCSKQAFRGHFRRASGRNLEKEGVGPSEREGASNIPLRGNFLASRSTSLFIALRIKSCSSWLCLFCSRTLSNRCLQTQIQKTNVLIHLALSHWILPHFIPCFICTRSRKQQKNMFSPARNSAGNTRGSLSLHCSQSLRRTRPESCSEKHCSVSRCSVSRHFAPLHPCSYTHGITNIFKKNAWRRSTQRAKSEARAWSSSNQRAKQSRALRKNCSKNQFHFTVLCFVPRRSTSLRAFIYTGSH